ncbi:uncharacterized protein JCM6883_003321 [Sporobolomyces salmoneus]|uniref:uncharacterized protein n=1 Tax=Sporobolomyces salmoneus TaxID=183962 RepID=UPI00316CD05B
MSAHHRNRDDQRSLSDTEQDNQLLSPEEQDYGWLRDIVFPPFYGQVLAVAPDQEAMNERAENMREDVIKQAMKHGFANGDSVGNVWDYLAPRQRHGGYASFLEWIERKRSYERIVGDHAARELLSYAARILLHGQPGLARANQIEERQEQFLRICQRENFTGNLPNLIWSTMIQLRAVVPYLRFYHWELVDQAARAKISRGY